MVQISSEELLGLVQQGVKGNAGSVALLTRRLISKLKKSQPKFAEQLAELLSQTSVTRETSFASRPVDTDSRRNLLDETFPVLLPTEPQWSEDIEKMLTRVVRERNASAQLIQAGLEPIQALLFKGPPGVGKTLAASWLARELKLPLLTLDLATMMSSLLGKTGTNLKAVMEYAAKTPCVLLLDEFDAIAKRRDDDADIGELKRLVNVLLQSIDEWSPSSLLVAATNHPELLDPAIWRRFDTTVDFGMPDEKTILRFLNQEGIDKTISTYLSVALVGESYAHINKMLQAAKKNAVLDGVAIEDSLLIYASDVIGDSAKPMNRTLQIINLAAQGISQRKIAEKLGVSHPTVGRTLKELKQALSNKK